MSGENYDHLFKLLLVGDSGVGKSSLLLRFTDGVFDEDKEATIGVDFKVKFLNVKGKRIKLTIWDTAGQERFRTLTSQYYRGAQGVILVYDVTRKETFDNLKNWLSEVEMYSTHPDVVKLLVGNKIDVTDGREVTRKMGEEFARTNGMLFIEASAKTKAGVDQTFDEVAHKILDTESLLVNTSPVRLEPSSNNEQGGGWCC
eukprot:GEZU01011984.1.p1 GENE.GEZU01011984.1~~GEZU01011984.1.p1  ORF type:complete len:201 (-),score=27.74 GEZU01011984.1:99-701(-)